MNSGRRVKPLLHLIEHRLSQDDERTAAQPPWRIFFGKKAGIRTRQRKHRKTPVVEPE